MIVAVIRHAKVDHKWKPRMTSAEYDKGCADYDAAPVLPVSVKLPETSFQTVYVSGLSRTAATARQVFGDREMNVDTLINEVPARSGFDTNLRLPGAVWSMICRIQWIFSRKCSASSNRSISTTSSSGFTAAAAAVAAVVATAGGAAGAAKTSILTAIAEAIGGSVTALGVTITVPVLATIAIIMSPKYDNPETAKNADKMPWPLNKVLGAVNTGARWAENTLGTVAEDIKRWPMEKELEYLKSKLMTLVFSVVKMLKGSLEKETEKNAKIARAEKSEKDKSQAHGLSNEKNKAKDHEKSKERLTDRANTGKEKTVAAMSKSSGKELSGAAGKSAEAAKAIISKNPAPKNINLGR